MTDNLSQSSKDSRMKFPFAIQALFVPMQKLLRLGNSSLVQEGAKSRFFHFENRIDLLLTFADEKELPLTIGNKRFTFAHGELISVRTI